MRTLGELEAAICEGVSRFEQDYMGRGPKDIYTHLLGDILVVRLQGVLTAAEQHLVKSLPGEKGRDLLKQVRTHLVETARPVLGAMVHEVTVRRAIRRSVPAPLPPLLELWAVSRCLSASWCGTPGRPPSRPLRSREWTAMHSRAAQGPLTGILRA